MATTHSGSGNIHRLTRPSPTVLVLEPGRVLWVWTFVFLGFVPIVATICLANRFEAGLTLGLSLFPLIGAVSMAVAGCCYHRFGTHVHFDRGTQRVSVTGVRHGGVIHLSVADIRAVQFCDAGIRQGEGCWHAYQVNLVLRTDTPARINLLDSGGETQLRKIAKEIADFLAVPFCCGSQTS